MGDTMKKTELNEMAEAPAQRRSKTAGSKRDEFVGDPGKTVEDYLEAILIVRERQGYVRSVDVAEQLEVSKPSVTYVTKKLKSLGYIDTDHAGMLILTKEGEAIASSTYDRHKTLTEYFISIGIDPKQAGIDACKVEHDISEETYKALCRQIKAGRQQNKKSGKTK